MAGFEVITMNPVLEGRAGTPITQRYGGRYAYAPAYGIAADWRLGYFTLGFRYQGSAFVDRDPARLDVFLNKVYADFGINARAKVLLFSALVSGGYTVAVNSATVNHGVGGRASLNFDFLISPGFTLGPGFSFDVQAFTPQGSRIGTYVTTFGGTSNLRIGFQISAEPATHFPSGRETAYTMARAALVGFARKGRGRSA